MILRKNGNYLCSTNRNSDKELERPMKSKGYFWKLAAPSVVSLVLIGMFIALLSRVDDRLSSVKEDLNNGRSIVLNPDCEHKLLSEIIFNNGYAETNRDADFIASILIERQNEYGRLSSLYSLQKRKQGQVRMSQIDSSSVMNSQREASIKRLGQDENMMAFCKDSLAPGGNGKIVVKVFSKEESHTRLNKLFNIDNKIPCTGVPVRLTTHFRDSSNQAKSIVVGYVLTDSTGVAVFDGLDMGESYSVLPIKKGREYGSSKGTTAGKWKAQNKITKKVAEQLQYSFEEKEHRIPLFSNSTLRKIKNERTILCRSPKEFKAEVVKSFVLVMIAWWILCIYLIIKKKKYNGTLLASCMFLSSLCVLMMFSMQDPLNDEMNGSVMGQGVIIGLCVCLLLQGVDFIKFYQNQTKTGFDIPLNVFMWVFKPYRQKISGLAILLKDDNARVVAKMLAVLLVIISLPLLLLDLLQLTRLSIVIDRFCSKLPKGIGWLALALILTAMLWTPFGQAVGGMKVNLNILGLKFQPSEIAKYLILLFMAAFFTQKADTIIAYSQPKRMDMLGSKIATLIWVIVGLAILMVMYIVLGDMGPGLVIGITFILLYSLIKSKVSFENLVDEDKWGRIFTCDFAMLIYGVLSFVAFLVVGHILGNMLIFGALWFAFWFVLGFLGFKKQIFESAILLNSIVFIFIFGGQILSAIPGLKDSSIVERFEERTKMCVNTWGDLDIEHFGRNAEPVSNTQVANGLWALASGGLHGQGLGEGKPSLVPAFHTDMILSSIGEQLGWVGLLLVVIALALLLRSMSVIGYRVGHPFAFYLCLGFAIVIGVQFFIIALGSSGMIPLTGVTVPFLSYGRVSMILNLAAFGIVLSLCNNISDDEDEALTIARKATVRQYSYPIAMASLVFIFIAIVTLAVWQYYQFWKRDSTLIHPAYVINTQGAPVVEYNPRINLLVNNMYAGRIYDRNNILLATSDKHEINPEDYVPLGIDKTELINKLKRNQKRYYPFGKHMFFMVGDQNEGLMFSYDESCPSGYMAEAQHLSYLRGFDNALYDNNGKPIKIDLKTDRFKESTYLPIKDSVFSSIQLRDYSALVKYLKDGMDGKKVEKHNKQVKEEKYDLHLTIDAALQVDLQNNFAVYMKEKYKGNNHYNLMRVSAVVLDAYNGDLLASANYPLPDYSRLREEQGNKYYSDNLKGKNWYAYTDLDLGTIYRTMPGSTAKVMSAMAGLRQCGTSVSRQTYYITNDDAVEKWNGVSIEPTGNVTMRDAIVYSSNCYFMNLVNDKDLYPTLETIYKAAGVSLGVEVPYIYTARQDTTWKLAYDIKIAENRIGALGKYAKYREDVQKGIHKKMDIAEWKWAWGQGWYQHELQASPLIMARVASSVVNNGEMPITQYLMGMNMYEKAERNESSISLMSASEAAILKEYMLAETSNQLRRNRISFPSYIGGKTGTPERSRILSEHRRYNKWSKKYEVFRLEEKINDGWYMFFVEGDESHHPIAVAVRIERGVGSGAAVRLTGDILLECLKQHGYIRN